MCHIIVTFRNVLLHFLLHFRYHNENLHCAVKKDFRRLSEKVSNNTHTGDEPHSHTFVARTPAEVEGAVSEVQV